MDYDFRSVFVRSFKGYLVDNSYEVVDVSGDSGSDFIETTLYRGR